MLKSYKIAFQSELNLLLCKHFSVVGYEPHSCSKMNLLNVSGQCERRLWLADVQLLCS